MRLQLCRELSRPKHLASPHDHKQLAAAPYNLRIATLLARRRADSATLLPIGRFYMRDPIKVIYFG